MVGKATNAQAMHGSPPGEQTRQCKSRNRHMPVRAWPIADPPLSSHLAHQNQVEDHALSVTLAARFRETHFRAYRANCRDCRLRERYCGAGCPKRPARLATRTRRSPALTVQLAAGDQAAKRRLAACTASTRSSPASHKADICSPARPPPAAWPAAPVLPGRRRKAGPRSGDRPPGPWRSGQRTLAIHHKPPPRVTAS